jgi:hypothetical protein
VFCPRHRGSGNNGFKTRRLVYDHIDQWHLADDNLEVNLFISRKKRGAPRRPRRVVDSSIHDTGQGSAVPPSAPGRLHPVTLMVVPPKSSCETVPRLGYSVFISYTPRVILVIVLLLFLSGSRLLPNCYFSDMKTYKIGDNSRTLIVKNWKHRIRTLECIDRPREYTGP